MRTGNGGLQNDKLRLDLYNRRFDLYLRVLALQDVLAGWTGSDREQAVLADFKRAHREARFLFPPESGVAEAFEQFSNASVNITSLNLWKRVAQEDESTRNTDWGQFRIDGYNLSVNARFLLEAKISPYLIFSNSADPIHWLPMLSARYHHRKRLDEIAKHAWEGSRKIRSEAEMRGGQHLY